MTVIPGRLSIAPSMPACDICELATATSVVHFAFPEPQEFTVCDTHADHAVINGATVRRIQ